MSTALTLTVAQDGSVVGRAILDFDRFDDAAYLYAVAVEAHARGRGIGTRLIRHAEQVAAAEGFTRIALGVEDANERARALYERLGYAASGDVLQDDGRTCGVLVKALPPPG
jgi:ribosomal protein S18 acetylase RimI-like enzyme